MEAPLAPRESAQFIAANSQDVSIEGTGVRKVAELLRAQGNGKAFSLEGWKALHELNPRGADEDAVNWVFLVDTLNFSFWSETDDRKCLVQYRGKEYSGYWSLCAAVNRALDEGIPITSASYYASVTLDQVRHVLRSDTDVPMPLIQERHRILNETGRILLDRFGGSFLHCVRESGPSALGLMRLVVESFPSYRDEAVFQGKRISFYKRAQILVADIWSVLEGKGDGDFTDIARITMFADYRLPQVLAHLGALKYSEELLKKLHKGEMFSPGDRQEVEIRGCSIWCVELIRDQLLELTEKEEKPGTEINSIFLDYYLWDYARDHREDMKGMPFHRTRCIYY
ncbi:queuosine salvage protein [Tachyglossus aculeatus]|uniref:queuosine salvage protein n=1 Tax=Tachyglossus aculeatus TaxID=9261 RepID=UPI0018F6DF03|nr:queuosine salvage protein [Tachyglossus aculeatus]